MLKKATPILASLNAEETIKFYTEKLGFTFHNDWDGYLIFSKDDISVHLWPTTYTEIPKTTGCYIYVTAVDNLFAAYKAQGVIHPNGQLKNMPWKMRQFSVLDNNGNIIHFGEDISTNEE